MLTDNNRTTAFCIDQINHFYWLQKAVCQVSWAIVCGHRPP